MYCGRQLGPVCARVRAITEVALPPRRSAGIQAVYTAIRGKNGDVDDLLDQLETVVEQSRTHTHRNLKQQHLQYWPALLSA